jgi:ferrous iron transport protein B
MDLPTVTASGAHCESCPAYNRAQLTKLGINMTNWDHVVALAGNPNTGKSTVFNALTGLRQHTGNWPGKTVVRAEGGFRFRRRSYKLVDLPGTYSLLSTSADEEVARDFLLFGRPDVTAVVVDATRLERNLNLVLQVLEITDRVVVALNLIDEAQRHGLKVDERVLARDLGVPVVPMAARQSDGIPELLQAIDEVAQGQYVTRPRRVQYRDSTLEAALQTLVTQLDTLFPGLANTRWVAMRLIEGDPSIQRAVREGTLGDLSQTRVGLPLNPLALEATS